MKRYCLLCCFILLMAVSGWCTPSTSTFPDRYLISIDSSRLDRVHVHARIFLEDSLLYMSPYGPMPERWRDFIEDLSVTGTDGQQMLVEKAPQGGWLLPGAERGQEIVLDYNMVLGHEQMDWPGGIDGVAYKRDWGIMASGRSLFIMNGNQKEALEVEISIPHTWKASVPWKALEIGSNAFRVSDLLALQESFIFVGTHIETQIVRDGFTLKFVLGGDAVQQEASRYTEVAAGVMDYYIELMRGVPRPGPGKEMQESLVIISEAETVDGEVIGNHISMFMDPKGDPFTQMMGWFMFAHEFYHLWNGKSLRFSTTQTDWFKEGVSNYYTIKALYQIDFASEATILAMLDKLFYQRYIHDPGFGSVAPYDATSGFNKDNHWGLIYGGGLFAGIALDMEIRHRTANTASLDDLMRKFYRVYGGTDKTIDQDAILQEVNRLGSTDFDPFMQLYIKGTESLSLAPYLIHAGMTVDASDDQLQFTPVEEKTELQAALWAGFLGEQ